MFKGETILSGAEKIPGVSDFKVMRSHAGWYIGTTCVDEEYGFEEPYSRETEYFRTEEEAQQALLVWKNFGHLPGQR